MSDQDNELQQQLRGAAADPRREWVDSLRSELEASWQAGVAPGRTNVSAFPSRRPVMRMWAVAGAVAVMIGAVAFALGGRSDSSRIVPAPLDPVATVPADTNPPPTDPSATVPAETTPPGTDPSATDPAVVPACTPDDLARWESDVYVTFTATAVWRLHPDGCTDAAGRWTGFTFTTTAVADTSTATYHIATDALVAAGVTLGSARDPWNAVRPIGVQGSTVVLEADGYRQIVRIDLQTGGVRVFPWPTRDEGDAVVDRRVYLVDDQLFGFETLFPAGATSYEAIGTAVWRFDLHQAGGVVEVLDDPLLAGAMPFGQVSEDGLLPPAQHHLMLQGGQGLLRLDADGSVRDLTAPGYRYFSVTTSGDNVWAIVLEPGSSGVSSTDANGGQLVEGAHGARLDVDTGAVLLTPPNPPGAADGEIGRTGSNGSLYFMHRTRQAWWLGNDGSVTTLRPFDGTPVGVIDDGPGTDLLVVITTDREPAVMPLADLLDQIVTPPTTG